MSALLASADHHTRIRLAIDDEADAVDVRAVAMQSGLRKDDGMSGQRSRWTNFGAA